MILVTVKTIIGEVNLSKLVGNIVENIKILVKAVRNVKLYNVIDRRICEVICSKNVHCSCT